MVTPPLVRAGGGEQFPISSVHTLISPKGRIPRICPWMNVKFAREVMRGGVLTATRDEGTIARVMAQAIQKNFEIMLFSSINKVINISIEEAAKVANTNKLSGTMGIPVSLFKVKGNLMTEVEAFNLQGVQVFLL